jgi:hypothetical protein
MPTKSARGETARRIYTVLHRNPDLTAEELCGWLPDLTVAAIRSALSKMEKRGAVAVRGVKSTRSNGCGRHANVYHVKYKSGAVQAAKPKKVAPPKKAPTPEVKAPKPSREAELIGILRDTLIDLAETKQALEAAQARRNWWDAVKGWFA